MNEYMLKSAMSKLDEWRNYCAELTMVKSLELHPNDRPHDHITATTQTYLIDNPKCLVKETYVIDDKPELTVISTGLTIQFNMKIVWEDD